MACFGGGLCCLCASSNHTLAVPRGSFLEAFEAQLGLEQSCKNGPVLNKNQQLLCIHVPGITLRTSKALVQCIVIAPVCVFVCGSALLHAASAQCLRRL